MVYTLVEAVPSPCHKVGHADIHQISQLKSWSVQNNNAFYNKKQLWSPPSQSDVRTALCSD